MSAFVILGYRWATESAEAMSVNRSKSEWRWQIEVKYQGDNKRLFEDVLRDFGVTVMESDTTLFLTSSAFDVCDDAKSVSDLAQAIADAVVLADGGPAGFVVGSRVREQRPDGSEGEHHVIRVRTGELRITLNPVTVRIEASTDSPEEMEQARERQREAEYQARFERVSAHARAAFKSPAAAKVRALIKAPELDTTTMNQIAERIQADLGKEGLRLLNVKDELDRFFHSIDHPKTFGDKARHAMKNTDPHKRPMNDADAEMFIRDLVEK